MILAISCKSIGGKAAKKVRSKSCGWTKMAVMHIANASDNGSVQPDSKWSWVIAILCGLIKLLTFGVVRNCGAFYISIIETFNTNREEASFPISFCYSSINFTGPLTAVILRYLDPKTVLSIGGALAAFGVILAHFATNVYHLTLTLGLMQGTGCGLILSSSQVIVGQYFIKNRSTASGIIFAGSNLGTLVFGPIILELTSRYPFKGTLLIIGGIMLNTIPLAMLLRSHAPRWFTECSSSYETFGVERQPLISKKIPCVEHGGSYGAIEPKSCRPNYCETKYSKNSSSKTNGISPVKAFSKVVKETLKFESNKKNYEQLPNNFRAGSRRLENVEHCVPSTKSNSAKATEKSVLRKELECIAFLLSSPMFLLCCMGNVIFLWILASFLITCVDVAIDNGLPSDKAVYIPPFMSVADLACRLGSGWITDKKYLKRKHMFAGSLVTMGLALHTMAWIRSPEVTIVATMLFGLACGTGITVCFVIFVDYYGLESLATAIGISGLLSGIVGMTRPPMIGYFRDTIGSYQGMLVLQGSLLIVFGLLWILEPCLLKGTLMERAKEDASEKSKSIEY